MGLYGAAGETVNTVTLVIPTLVLVVGTADCVHLPHAWSEPARPAVRVGAAAIAVLAILGVAQLTVDTNSIGYLFPDHPVRQDSRLIEEKLGPCAPLEFVLDSDSTVLRAPLMRTVRTREERAVATGAVGWHHSAVDVLYRAQKQLTGRAQLETAGQIRTLLELGRSHSQHLADLSAHPSQFRVTFGIPVQSARGVAATMDSVKAAASVRPSDARVAATGYLPLYVRMTDLIVEAQLRSFGLALLVIPAVIAFLFGGLWAAGWSLGPNLLPVLITLGAMGWTGIPLDIVTVTIAVIIFGLVVDDTVHLLHRYAGARQTRSREAALEAGARRAGRMMAITTTVLAGGFLVLGLAHNRSVVWFGLLIAGALVAAFIVDLLVLPALLSN